MIRAGAVERAAEPRLSPAGGERSEGLAPRFYGMSFADRGAGLTVGRADDPAEAEADLMAEHALAGLALLRPLRGGRSIRRMCAECEEEEHKVVRRSHSAGAAPAAIRAPPAVSRLMAQPGHGLDPAARKHFEERFERSFADVSVHEGPAADAAAKSIGARAFTAGSSIAFASGQYAPRTPQGMRLLAHELAHVAQGGAPVIRRDGNDFGPLQRVILALVENTPPVFRATFIFEKSSHSFKVKLMTGTKDLTGIRESTQRLSASPFYHQAGDKIPAAAVLFTLPDQDGAYLWFEAVDDNKDMLVRASVYLQEHDPVTLSIVDQTRTIRDEPGDKEGGEGKPGDKGEQGGAPGPKFIDAEPWLAKEMLPAAKAALAADHPSVQAGALIPYRSVAIRKSEGPDISLIQVNKPGSKAIAGHVRVDRRKWVGQEAAARQRYAGEIASAIASRLTESARKERLSELDAQNAKKSAGETFPAWAIKLKDLVEKKLGDAKAAWPPAKAPGDIPDRLGLAHVGELVHFRIFIEREASNAPGKTVWQMAIMSPWLDEDQLEDVDALVRTVRDRTAAMRDHQVKLVEESDEEAPSIILMDPIPSQIDPKNLNSDGTSIIGATNKFEMDVRIDVAFSWVGGNDMLNMMGYSEQLGLGHVPIRWKVVQLTTDNAEDLWRAPGKQPEGDPPLEASNLYFDLANRKIDQSEKVGLATHMVDMAAIMRSDRYSLADTTHGVLDDLEYSFPSFTGIYLVVAETVPRPIVTPKYREIFAPSRAVLPVRVTTAEELAAETVSQTPNVIAEKEKAKENPSLSESDAIEIQADIDKLKKLEGMTQLGVTKAAEEDIDGKIKLFTDLRTWLLADQAAYPGPDSIAGSATTDSLVVRMRVDDQLHDGHLFAAFQQLYLRYGDHAFDTNYLAQPIDSKEGQYHCLNAHIALLGKQKEQSQKLQGKIQSQDEKFKKDSTRQMVATLVLSETGNAVPLLLLVGETPDSKPGAHRYKIVDLTFFSMMAETFNADDNTYAPGSASDTPDKALDEAFAYYGEKNEYDPGMIYYRAAGQSEVRRVRNIVTGGEVLKKWAMPLAILGMVASMVATMGATTPAVAAVIATITLANAAYAIYASSEKLLRRRSAGTLDLDIDAALDVLNILVSIVGIGALARGRQLAQVAEAAEASGNLAKAASALGKIKTLGRNMLIFDTAALGATAVLTGWKVSQDVARIKALHLPPDREAAILEDIAADAIVQGAMMAFQTVMLAHQHLEMYKNKVETSRYRSMEEKTWFDSEGRLTDQAPAKLRSTLEGKTPPVAEKPPVSLESDLPRIKAAAEQGEARELINDPEHDLEIPFFDEHGDPHSFKRRRKDGAWCRYSNRFCYFDSKDLERIEDQIGDLEGVPPPRKSSIKRPLPDNPPEKNWTKTSGDAATLTDAIEDRLDKAVAATRRKGGGGLDPRKYGIKLHGEIAKLFRKMKLPKGWKMFVEKPLRQSRNLDPKVANMPVRTFLEANAPWLIDELPPGFFVKKNGKPQLVGDIEADLVLIRPDGTAIAWDLAPTQTVEHIAKTIVYGHAGSSSGSQVIITETYYHPERNLTLHSEQAAYRGPAADSKGARLSVSDVEALRMAKRNLGEGEPMTPDLPSDPARRKYLEGRRKRVGDPKPLAAGEPNAVELIKGKKVIGEYLDPKSKKWVKTKNFTIHYRDGGAFIVPEAP